MMNRRDFLQAAGVTAASGLFPAMSWAKGANTVRITSPSPGSAGSAWAPIVAKYKLDQGLNTQLDWIVGDPGKMQVQLSAGSLDVGVFGSVGLATLVNRGSDIVLFGPALNNHGRWIVRGNSPYKTPNDLRGKRIATTAQTSETYIQARIAASLTGLDLEKDVQIIFGSPTANLALFERGDVDGIITLEPTATRLVGRGAREIARVADIWKQATDETTDPFLVGLAASRGWYDKNRKTAATLAALFERIGTTIAQHPDSLKTIASDLGLKPDETQAINLLPQRLAPAYASKWDASVFATIDKQIEVAAKLGILDAVPKRKLYVQA